MTTRALILLAALAIAPASATEIDRRDGWRIEVCEPGKGCDLRGRVLGGVACSVDLASMRWVVADGSHLACVRIVKGTVVRR